MNSESRSGAAAGPPVWSDLCALSDLSPDRGKYVVHQGRALAVFRLDQPDGTTTVRITDDACPHAGGCLCAGTLDRGIDPPAVCIVCPRHAWPFNLDTGACPDNENYHVRTYPARVVDGRVQIG